MSGGVITAAWIQAAGTFLPTTALAGAALLGLKNWRRQLLEQRQVERRVERVENCLVAADDVVAAIRAIRGTIYLTQEEMDSAPSFDWAVRAAEERAVQRAIDALTVFHREYRRTSFYIELPEPNTDEEFRSCLNELETAFRQMRHWEKQEEQNPAARARAAEFRGRFLGQSAESLDPSKPPSPDALIIRLGAALDALEKKLLPVTGGQRRPRSPERS